MGCPSSIDLVANLAANGSLFLDLPSICALRPSAKSHLDAWNAVLLSYFRFLCDLDRPCRLLAAKEQLTSADDTLDLDALTHCIHSLVLRVADLEKIGRGREEMSLISVVIADHKFFYDLVFINEFAAEIAFASGGAEWTEDASGKSERVRVYRFPPPGWDLGWSKKNQAPCYWKQQGHEISASYPGKKAMSGPEKDYVFQPGPAEAIGMCLTEDGFITEVLPHSQAAAYGISPLSFVHRVGGIEVSSLPGHTENDPAGSTCAWNLVRRCRLGTEPFIISILRRPKPNLDDLGLFRDPTEDRMHLPPDWVEVVPPGWGTRGKSYYKNSWTGQCCEFQPLPHPIYPRRCTVPGNDMQMLLERQRAVNAAARAMTTGAKGSNKAFGRDKAVILRLLRDMMHDMHEPLRQRAIQSFGELVKLDPTWEVFTCLESRAFDDSPVVLNALIDALTSWQEAVEPPRGYDHEASAKALIKKHEATLEAHRQKFPDGYGFRMDVNEFLQGLAAEGSDEETVFESDQLADRP
eukprot:symbB.v1.2.025836.t1/scaffold2536.1/size76742/2